MNDPNFFVGSRSTVEYESLSTDVGASNIFLSSGGAGLTVAT